MSDETSPAQSAEAPAAAEPDRSGDPEWLRERFGAYHRGEKYPDSPEELMGSRYAAYALGEIDWIIATHHPDKREEVDRKSTEVWSKSSRWLGYEVTNVLPGTNEDHGFVEFIAHYKLKGGKFTHRERAEFQRVEGKWYFVDGQELAGPPVRKDKVPGRNDPCSCGSGKKYKKCCGRAA